MKVNINEVVSELEMVSDEVQCFYNTKNGEFITLFDSMICDDEDNEELRDEIEKNWKQYISLPDQYDIHEYHIMEKFIWSMEDEKIAKKLESAIHGSGAFRRFKDILYILDMQEEWYQYLNEEYKRIAIEWCEDNDIEYKE